MKKTNRINLIPFGMYCYDHEGMCPHFEAKESKQGIIIKSFCHYKACSDFKLNDKNKICDLNIS